VKGFYRAVPYVVRGSIFLLGNWPRLQRRGLLYLSTHISPPRRDGHASAMRKTLATLALMAFAGTAHAATFHYACKSGESRYALTVNTDRGIVSWSRSRRPTRSRHSES
jgi:hypothetical protein